MAPKPDPMKALPEDVQCQIDAAVSLFKQVRTDAKSYDKKEERAFKDYMVMLASKGSKDVPFMAREAFNVTVVTPRYIDTAHGPTEVNISQSQTFSNRLPEAFSQCRAPQGRS